ncbi:MAG: hypothetical protein K8I27_05915 [Planctomycetes bacterium]|nr:hypothetical protein [Planctomycetota bacterium]
MENLKKNLHFAVLGGGVLLGIILVVVGIIVRGGTEEQLETANSQLQGKTSVHTKGTLDDLEKRSGRFKTSLEQAEGALKAATRFDADYDSHTNGTAFYTNEANRKVRVLKERWDALTVEPKLPRLLSGWAFGRLSGYQSADTFWDRLQNDIGDPAPERIPELQRQLRILDELVTTCERLKAAGLDGGRGVKLLDFKAENYASMTNNKLDSPWMVMQWDLKIECSPGFAILLFDELANPSALTMAEVENQPNRRGFPMLPMNLQTEMVERPAELRFDVSNDDKAGVLEKLNEAGASLPVPPDPKSLDPAKSDGRRLVEAIQDSLNKTDRVVLPVRAGLRMRAAGYNSAWRATNAPEDSQ